MIDTFRALIIEPSAWLAPPQPAKVATLISADAKIGIAWYNRLSRAERTLWHRVAGSAVPADCWRAFQAGVTLPD